jgi:biotin carboxyl carrier protein
VNRGSKWLKKVGGGPGGIVSFHRQPSFAEQAAAMALHGRLRVQGNLPFYRNYLTAGRPNSPIFVAMAEVNYQIAVNGGRPFKVEEKEERLLLDGTPVAWSSVPLPDGSFSLVYGTKSFVAQIVAVDTQRREMSIRISGRLYQVHITEPLDALLESLGIAGKPAPAAGRITAPMPGMVLRILVSPGQQLKKGDPVLVLEAMKMENVFKAPGEATVKDIPVKEGTAVEKGQVLIVLA